MNQINNQEDIKLFMILKKRKIEEENKKKHEEIKNRQEKLKKNLTILDNEIKKCKQKSTHRKNEEIGQQQSIYEQQDSTFIQNNYYSNMQNKKNKHAQSTNDNFQDNFEFLNNEFKKMFNISGCCTKKQTDLDEKYLLEYSETINKQKNVKKTIKSKSLHCSNSVNNIKNLPNNTKNYPNNIKENLLQEFLKEKTNELKQKYININDRVAQIKQKKGDQKKEIQDFPNKKDENQKEVFSSTQKQDAIQQKNIQMKEIYDDHQIKKNSNQNFVNKFFQDDNVKQEKSVQQEKTLNLYNSKSIDQQENVKEQTKEKFEEKKMYNQSEKHTEKIIQKEHEKQKEFIKEKHEEKQQIENKQIQEKKEDENDENPEYLFELSYDQLQQLKEMLQKGDSNDPEVQILTEQIILYEAAATIIQKVFRGYLTRKLIHLLNEEEEEEDYYDENFYLEENQIEPEELLEGNNINFNYLKATKPQQEPGKYDASEQLKEYLNQDSDKKNKNNNQLEEEIKKIKEMQIKQWDLIQNQLKIIQDDQKSKLSLETTQNIANLFKFIEDNKASISNQQNSTQQDTQQENITKGFFSNSFSDEANNLLDKLGFKHEQIEELIQKREQTIDVKHQNQLDLINKLHSKSKISPKSYKNKQIQLEKWVTKEKLNLKKAHSQIEKGMKIFAQTMKQTKRDLQLIEQMKGLNSSKLLQSCEEEQLRKIFSLRSESEHSIEDLTNKEDRKSFEELCNLRTPQENQIKIVESFKINKNIFDESESNNEDFKTCDNKYLAQKQSECFISNGINQHNDDIQPKEVLNIHHKPLDIIQQEDDNFNLNPTNNTNHPGLECATLNYIKDYLVAFSEYIKDNFKDEFLEKINISLGIDPLEFLKAFNLTENLENSGYEIQPTPIYPIIKYIQVQKPVVSEDLYHHFNDIFNKERDFQNCTNEILELEKYHMKMTFDCFNEALDSMRPFGLRGKPLPWKMNSTKLCSIKITQDNIEKILGLAIAKVLKWGSSLCGFIPERIESPTGEIIQIDDDYLNQIKEDRLAQMLENEVIENEDKWLQYEDEETDVQLEIADEVFNYLIWEVIEFIFGKKIISDEFANINNQGNIFQQKGNNCYKSTKVFQGFNLNIKEQQMDQKMIDKQIFLINMQQKKNNNQIQQPFSQQNNNSQKDLNSSF